MTILTEGNHAGEFIVSEVNPMFREAITVLSGEVLKAGAVLGKITASGKYVEVDPAASDGSQAAAGVLFDNVDATGADKRAVALVRLSVLNAQEIVWPDAISSPNKATAIGQLAALNIVLR